MKTLIDVHICQYCGKICKNTNSLKQHEIRCKMNPNKINVISNFIKYNDDIKSGKIERKYKNSFDKAKKLDLPKPKISTKTRELIGNAWRGKQHTEETKQKISNSMKLAVRNNPNSYSSSNVNGRVKHIEYNGIILDSSWEVIVAKYLDKNNIKWIKPSQGFEYIWNNNIHIYYPDFYLPKYDKYIEVKGYKRERDLYKWKTIQNLIIISSSEINDIKYNKYNIYELL